MNVEVTKLPESRVALKIELTPEEVEQSLERTYRSLVQRVNIPGFRKGKAPRQVVERLVGHELFLHEATEEAVRWGYRKAIEQEKLVPIEEADIRTPEGEHEHVEPREAFHFEATVAVRPEVQLPDYQSLHVEREQAEVTNEDVDSLLEEIRRRNATLEPTVRPAQIGDVVSMNITGRSDGEEVLTREDFDFTLANEEETGPHPSLPGLAAELLGASRGDIREINLHLPENYSEQELAGKLLMVRVLVKEIKHPVLPELDDELAQSVSQFQTLAELKEGLRENLELERKLQADEKLVNDALEAVSSRTFVEIPPVLVEEELDRMVGELRDNFTQAGLDFNTYLSAANRSEADIRGEMRESAVRNVKTSLVVGAVADAEGIEVTNNEVAAALDDLLRGAGIAEAERRRLRNNAAVRSSVRSRVRRRRALQRLVETLSGEDVAPEATDAVADQTAAAAEDTQENVAVEVAG